MRNKKLLGPLQWIILVLILISILAALVTCSNTRQNTRLPAYTETQPSETEAPVAETASVSSHFLPMTFQVPKDWQHVLDEKEKTELFVNPQDSATLQMTVCPYDPAINNYNASAFQSEISAANGIVYDFAKNNSHSYLAYYSLNNKNYFEAAIWDRENIALFTLVYPGQQSEYYTSLMLQFLDSVSWDMKSPIPETLILKYNSFGNYEFGIPITWQQSIQDSSLVAQSESGSQIVNTVIETDISPSSMSQEQIMQELAPNIKNYEIVLFNNTNDALTIEIVYMIDNIKCHMIANAVLQGKYLYLFSFACSDGAYATDGLLYEQAVKYFRVF